MKDIVEDDSTYRQNRIGAGPRASYLGELRSTATNLLQVQQQSDGGSPYSRRIHGTSTTHRSWLIEQIVLPRLQQSTHCCTPAESRQMLATVSVSATSWSEVPTCKDGVRQRVFTSPAALIDIFQSVHGEDLHPMTTDLNISKKLASRVWRTLAAQMSCIATSTCSSKCSTATGHIYFPGQLENQGAHFPLEPCGRWPHGASPLISDRQCALVAQKLVK